MRADYEAEKAIVEQRGLARDALAGMLKEYVWDSFFTSTFAHRVAHPRQAMALVSRALGISLDSPCHRAFLAAEPHRFGGYHVHGLAMWEDYLLPDGSLSHRIDYAKANLGRLGWSRCQAIRDIGGTSGYCSKYLTKELSDWDLYGDLAMWSRVLTHGI